MGTPDTNTAVIESPTNTEALADAAPEVESGKQSPDDVARAAWDKMGDDNSAKTDATGDAKKEDGETQQTDAERNTIPALDSTDDTITTAKLPDGADQTIAALIADGMPHEQIVAWAEKDPDGFAAYGKNRVGTTSPADTTDHAATAKTDTKTEPPADPLPGLVEAVKESTEKVLAGIDNSGIFNDDEGGKQVLGVLTTEVAQNIGRFVQKLVSQQADEVKSLRQYIEDQQGAARVESEIAKARTGLLKQYPKLADDGYFGEVLKHYDLFAEAIERKPVAQRPYKTPEEVLALAVRLHASSEHPANATEKVKRDILSRIGNQRRGTPTTRAGGSGSTKALTPEQRAWQKFNTEIAPEAEKAGAA